MLPDVENEQRNHLGSNRRIGIGARNDLELAAIDDKPDPPAAELICRSLAESALELVEGVECAFDRVADNAVRFAAVRR